MSVFVRAFHGKLISSNKIRTAPKPGAVLCYGGEVLARRKVADANEVLKLLTEFMRGGVEGAGVRERLRAAELLGKRLGLFEPELEEGNIPVVIEGSDRLT